MKWEDLGEGSANCFFPGPNCHLHYILFIGLRISWYSFWNYLLHEETSMVSTKISKAGLYT